MEYNPLFNREHYSQDTISKFDILGSYFVKTFYNVLYRKAQAQWTTGKPGESLTFYYKKLIRSYVGVIKASNKTDSYCKKTMEKLCEYYTNKTGHESWSYTKFLNVMSREFFPLDFIDNVKIQQKQHSFEKCIISALTAFEHKIHEKYFTYIIDDHTNAINTHLLRDLFIDNLLFQREEMYGKIAKRSSDEHIPKYIVDKISQERNIILNSYNKLKHVHEQQTKIYEKKIADSTAAFTQIKEYFKEACERVLNNDALIQEHASQINAFQEIEIKLKQSVETLTLQNQEYVRTINDLNKKLGSQPELIQSHVPELKFSTDTKPNSVDMQMASLSSQHNSFDMLDNVLSETLRQQPHPNNANNILKKDSPASTLSSSALMDFTFNEGSDSNLLVPIDGNTNLF